jgi:hypothetical protein
MNNNLYAPPKAPVADLLPGSSERPVQVRLAAFLLWISFGIGAVNTDLLQWQHLKTLSSLGFTMLIQSVVLFIFSWITYKVWCGRNWARFTFLVLIIGGLPFFLPQLPAIFAQSWVSGSIGVAQTFMQLGAVYLVFFSLGRTWFKRLDAELNTVFKADVPEGRSP